mgnify:CR=1 FL=1
MGSLKLPHASGNSVSIAAPESNPASDRTLYVPSNANGTILTNTTPGCILQVVQLNLDGGFTTSSTSFTDVSGYTQNITTTGSNKVLVETQTWISNAAEHFYSYLKLLRGSTELQQTVRMQDSIAGAAGGYVGMSVLDSPGAGTHTYKVQFKTENASNLAKIAIGATAGTSTADTMPDSILRLMEVAV